MKIYGISPRSDNDPYAKVVIVSAPGQESFIKEAVMSGAKYFIVKPFKEEHVVNTLIRSLKGITEEVRYIPADICDNDNSAG